MCKLQRGLHGLRFLLAARMGQITQGDPQSPALTELQASACCQLRGSGMGSSSPIPCSLLCSLSLILCGSSVNGWAKEEGEFQVVYQAGPHQGVDSCSLGSSFPWGPLPREDRRA